MICSAMGGVPMAFIRTKTTRKVPEKGFTHAGVFHADDVFAAALLRILNPEIEILRGSEADQGFDGIVFDIGGGPFDHHSGVRLRENGIPYAAFGLVWDAFGDILLPDADDRAFFDERFVQPIDLADNAGGRCEIAEAVACFNPEWDSEEDPGERFEAAVDWARMALERRLQAIAASRRAHDAVVERMGECDGSVLVLDRYMPWRKAVAGSSYVYVVYPSSRGGFCAQGVPEALDGRVPKLPFPEPWRGKPPRDLVKITGIPDITFCHLAGFLCAADSLDGALSAASKSLEVAI